VFDFRLSRSRDGPRQFLAGVEGIFQTDGHAAYQGVDGPKVAEAACSDSSGPARGWAGRARLPGGRSSAVAGDRHRAGAATYSRPWRWISRRLSGSAKLSTKTCYPSRARIGSSWMPPKAASLGQQKVSVAAACLPFSPTGILGSAATRQGRPPTRGARPGQVLAAAPATLPW